MVLGFAAFLLQPFCVSLDAPHHLRMAGDFFLAFMDSPGYPDWDALAYGGRGSMAFRCIAPLTYLVSGAWQLLGARVEVAVKLTVVSFALLGAWGIRRWMCALGLERAAGWGILVWLAGAPIALHADFFFFFQNLCAMLAFPLILAGWSESRAVSGAIPRYPFALTLGFGLICWTHLQSAMMIAYVCAFLAVYEAVATRSSLPFRRLLVMIVAGACLAAPHILPFVATIGDIHLNRVMAGMKVGVDTRFVDDAFATHEGRAVSAASAASDIAGILAWKIRAACGCTGALEKPGQIRPNEMLPWEILQPIVLATFGTVSLSALASFTMGAGGAPFPFLAAGIVLLLLTLRVSSPLWAVCPGWYSLQFPFRWLLPAHVLIVPAVARLFSQEVSPDSDSSGDRPAPFGRLRPVGIAAFAGMVCTTLVFHLLTASFDDDGFRMLREGYGVSQEFAPAVCELPGRLSGKAGEPHLPRLATGAGTIEAFEAGFSWARYTVSVTASEGARLAIGTHFDRAWRLESSAGSVSLEPERPCGTMNAWLPAGTHEYRLERAAPPFRNLGWLLAIGGCFFAWAGRKNAFRLKEPSPDVDTGR
ncbi:MAG TPA: hypothetical protein PLU72_00555 [Candidatus Ozemobacteraceae bacterium]|nr:hypothetical protein [Candidatus Ozemobacteraceae bacterium]